MQTFLFPSAFLKLTAGSSGPASDWLLDELDLSLPLVRGFAEITHLFTKIFLELQWPSGAPSQYF